VPLRNNSTDERKDASHLGDDIYHFVIDGHEFMAVSNDAFIEPDKDEPLPRRPVVGRIFTLDGNYVILDERTQKLSPAPSLAEALSRREVQVALHIADGRCDKEIARALGISIYTVREHIRRIFAKLRVTRRSAIAQHMLRVV
jgi:DNA-binding CsgD family transcriptional regulator